MPAKKNIFTGIPEQLPGELIEPLVNSNRVRVERIVSLGHASPDNFWYDQETDEWVIVLTGEAKLQIEGEASARRLKRGDYVHLPARVRHRVTWTAPDRPTVWLAVHY